MHELGMAGYLARKVERQENSEANRIKVKACMNQKSRLEFVLLESRLKTEVKTSLIDLSKEKCRDCQ